MRDITILSVYAISTLPVLMKAAASVNATRRKHTLGSRENKFTILGVEAPAWQGVKVMEYRDILSFHNVARRDASAYKM